MKILLGNFLNFLIFIILFFFVIQIEANEKVTLYLKWKHQFQFAGFYIAKEKGFFDFENLDVDIKEREPKINPSDEVLKQTGNYGISDSSLVLDYIRGKKVVIVAAIFQHSPLVLVTRAEDNYFGPQELKNKKVMFFKDIDDAVITAMFESVSINRQDIIHVPHSLKLEDFIEKRVDAQSIYSTNQTYVLNQRNIKYHLIYPHNYGIDFYGDIIFTSADEVSKHPERVRAFRRASIKGWKYALDHIDESVDIVSKYSVKNKDFLKYEAIETKKMILPETIDIGTTGISRLQRIADIYRKSEKIDNEDDLKNILFDHLVNYRPVNEFISKWWFVFIGLFFTFIIGLSYYNKILSREVSARTKQLMAIIADRELFFSRLTHELRTPLIGVIGASEELNESNLSKSQREWLGIINNSGKILLKLVNDILDFSKLNKSKLQLESNVFDLSKIITGMNSFYRERARVQNLHFETKYNYDLPLWLIGDEIRLSQVFHNLLSNAFKFTDSGEVILEVTVNEIKDIANIEFKVSDSGIGISEEKMGKLFLPFEQLSSEISKQSSGTGLGLSITKELVKMMGGDLIAAKNGNQGMIFSFSLSLECASSTSIPINDTNKSNIPKVKFSFDVLITDDNEINRLFLEKYLLKLGCSVTQTESGKEALSKLQEKQFDILFIDINMPDMDGFEVIKQMHLDFNPNFKPPFVICCSAEKSLEINGNSIDGMNASIGKPILEKDLVKILSSVQKK